MGKTSLLHWSDFVILLNISAHITIIPCLLGLNSVSSVGIFLAALNMCTIFGLLKSNQFNFSFLKSKTIGLMFSIYVWEVFKTPFITGTSRIDFAASLLLIQLTFIIILLIRIQTEHNVDSILRMYKYLCLYIVLTTVICWILLNFRFIIFSTPVNYYIMNSNIEEQGHSYFFPHYLSVYLSNVVRMPLLHSYGIPCGLSHEPHVSTFFVTPGLLMYLSGSKKAWLQTLWLILSIFFFTISISVTNVLCLFIVLVYYSIKTNRKSFLYLSSIIAFVGVVLFNFTDIGNEFYNYIEAKAVSGDSESANYTIDHIIYALSPKSLIGTTLYTTSVTNAEGIGAVTCLLNLLFFLSYTYDIGYCIRKAKINQIIIVCACLYFYLHSIKTNTLNYYYPFTLYMIVITKSIKNNLAYDKRKCKS